MGIELPKVKKNYKSSWAQYTILLPENINRDKLQDYLKSKKIPTAVYYPIPGHLLHSDAVFGQFTFSLLQIFFALL